MATPSAQQHHHQPQPPQQQHQDYFRSVSSESTTYMMVPTGAPSPAVRKEAPSKMWLAMVVIVVVVLQIASTTGLFVYLNMSISQVRSCSPLRLSQTRTNFILFLFFLMETGWLHKTQSAVFKIGSPPSLQKDSYYNFGFQVQHSSYSS